MQIPDNVRESPMKWSGRITMDGPEVEIYGTIQDIHAQIMAANPSITATIPEERREHSGFSLWKVGEREIPMANRSTDPDQQRQDKHECKINDRLASDTAIEEGITYLRQHQGNCLVQPNSWSRISCFYDSAIHWHNVNDYAISLPCGPLADEALNILNDCQSEDANGGVNGEYDHVNEG